MQSLELVWAFIHLCPSLNIYLNVYPILYFFLFGCLPFLLRTWFLPLSGCIFPSSGFSFSHSLLDKKNPCLQWIFWSLSSSIRRCYGSMKCISCIYHFISSICTSWGPFLVKYRTVMLYKFLKGQRRRQHKFWVCLKVEASQRKSCS